MKELKNKAHSIRMRLHNIAKHEGMELNNLIILYMQERILFRLSQSQYQESFILKGGLFLFAHQGFKGRPTQDMDFLGKRIDNDLEEVRKVFKEILSIDSNDGLIFSIDTLTVENIADEAKYKGIRVRVRCFLGVAVNTLAIDIGFGDSIVPKPIEMDFPVLLDSEPVPVISTYSLESVIAEKFQAMVRHAFQNSRLKDFYDLRMLLHKYNFDGRVLQEAIQETFENRETPFNKKSVVFTEEFINDENKEVQWRAFLRRIGIKENSESFSEIMKEIIGFVKPLWDCICKGNEFLLQWDYEEKEWKRLKR